MQDGTVLVQLVTRVPADLRRRVRVQCLQEDRTVTEFVVEALTEKLGDARGGASRRRKSR